MRQRLGIDTFSLRWQGWDAFQLIEYAAGMRLDNVHFSERRNLTSLDAAYLGELRAHAASHRVAIEIGMNSFDRHAASFRPELGSGEEQLRQMIAAARVVGSPVVRCFLGGAADRVGSVPFDEHVAECERVLRSVAPAARENGVRVAIENHGGVDLLGGELRRLIEAIGPDVVGACMDTGNPAYGGEDPLVTAEHLAQYAVTSHVRDTAVWESPDGAMAQWVPLGQGNTDLSAILRLLAECAPECPVDLEIITGNAPSPVRFLTEAFWRAYPRMPAAEFARFVGMAREGTRRGLGPRRQLEVAWTEPPSAAWIEQQRVDFEISVRYARDVLGLGRQDAG